MTNPNDLAFPFCWEWKERENGEPITIVTANQKGLTKREEFAKAAMIGLLSSPYLYKCTNNIDLPDLEIVADNAIAYANKLIEKLNKENESI